MKKLMIGIFVVLAAGSGYYFYSKNQSFAPPEPSTSDSRKVEISFQEAKKSAHYESNTPAHAAILPGAPSNVVIDFNFDLAENSSITITDKDKNNYGAGETEIDQNKLSMRQVMNRQSPDGIYTVSYKACWPDGSCHDGKFQFAIDRTLVSQATNMTNQSEVFIDMKNIKFAPETIRISRGSKVTWINSDSVIHYINTDSHPAHTFYPAQNSSALKKDDAYSLVFSQPGVYPYHCSAHARGMTGILVVE